MNDPETRYQTMLSKLVARKCRITSHRIALLHLIAESAGHPNASQLYQHLRVQFPSVSLATIYKTLSLLKEEGEVLEIDLRNDSHYDGNKPFPHPHLICTKCSQIIDGDALPSLEEINQDIEKVFGFHVTRQQMVFYGLCPECRVSGINAVK